MSTIISPAWAVPIGNDVEYIPSPRNLGVNIIAPQAKLDVNGQILIRGGAPAAGRVLTSNAVGLASWQPVTSITNVSNSTVNNNTVNGSLSFNKNGSLLNAKLNGTTTINGKVLFTSNTKLEPFTVNGTTFARNFVAQNGGNASVTADKFFGGSFLGNGAGLTRLNANQVLGNLSVATIPGGNVTGTVSSAMTANTATSATFASSAGSATNATDAVNATNLVGPGSITGSHNLVSGSSIIFSTGSSFTLGSGVGIQGDQSSSIFTGNGSGLRHIPASAIVGGVPASSNLQNATLNGTTLVKGILSFAPGTKVQPFTVNGTAFARNFVAQNGGNASVTADRFFANTGFFGSGAGLTNLTGANVVGAVPTATNATSASSLASGATITNATLSGTTTNTGTISGGTILNASLSGTINNNATISGGNFNSNAISFATLSGTTTNMGTISGGTIANATLSNVSGTISNATNATNATNLTGGGTVTNTTLTSGNSLTGTLSNSGTISGGTISNATTISVIGNINLSGNASPNNAFISAPTIWATGGPTGASPNVGSGFVGDGRSITNIQGLNVVGAVASATTAASVNDNSITSAKIVDGTIISSDLAANAIASSAWIADGIIISADIFDGTIATVDLANNAVTTAKIADGSVTSAKLSGTISVANFTGNLAGDVTGTQSATVIANNAVTSAKILDGSITSADIADGNVTSADITDGAIATADLANNAVTSAKILDGTIVDADIASVGASKVTGSFGNINATGTVTASSFSGSGANLTGITASSFPSNTTVTLSNTTLSGSGTIKGQPPVRVVNVASNSTTATASCASDEYLIGGGGDCDTNNGYTKYSMPSPNSTGSAPTSWMLKCTQTTTINVFAICAKKYFTVSN